MRKRAYAFTIAFFLLSVFTASVIHASVEYTVRKGDTLAAIAKKHGIKLRDLQKKNDVSARHLKPGAVIIIPDAKTVTEKSRNAGMQEKERAAAVEASLSGTQDEESASQAVKVPDILYHIVRRGDTVASLSRKYSIDPEELKELNGLKSSKLRKGRKLIVRRLGPKTYTVKKGDSLWKIAKKFDMDPEDLISLNELDSSSLSIGRKLYLEEKVDPATAESYNAEIEKHVSVEEEIKEEAASEEFTHKPMADKLVTFAKKLVNIPYKFGGNSILGIDCSAYVKKVYGLLGIELPRTAREQFKTGEAVGKDELSIGDLVFFRTYASFPSHVGIYLGNNLFIHASSKDKKVTINSLETPYYLKRFIGGKRLLIEESQAETDPNN